MRKEEARVARAWDEAEFDSCDDDDSENKQVRVSCVYTVIHLESRTLTLAENKHFRLFSYPNPRESS